MQEGQSTFKVVYQGNDFVQPAHLENIQHDWLCTHQNGLATFGTRTFGSHKQDTQSSAAEVIQPGNIHNQRGTCCFEQAQHFTLGGLGVTGIQAALWRKNTRRGTHRKTYGLIEGASYYAHIA
jgi:hypothetical protein